MRCLKCGKECTETENFCSHCGAPLIKAAPSQRQCDSASNMPTESYYNPYVNETTTQAQSPANGYAESKAHFQEPKRNSKLGTYALILGIVGILLSCITALGLLIDMAAIIVGIVSLVTESWKKEKAITGIICGCIGLFLFFVSLFGGLSDPNTEMIEGTQVVVSTESSSDVPTEKTDTEDKQVEAEKDTETPKNEAKDSEKEFKKSCQKFNYKKIARNPDDYIGQNFKVTVRISSISEEGLFSQAYMKAFTDDGSYTYWDHMIYIFDDQDEDSDSYLNVLEDDIITVYGTFEGTEDTTNILNGEKSKDIALHMKYAKLIKE